MSLLNERRASGITTYGNDERVTEDLDERMAAHEARERLVEHAGSRPRLEVVSEEDYAAQRKREALAAAEDWLRRSEREVASIRYPAKDSAAYGQMLAARELVGKLKQEMGL